MIVTFFLYLLKLTGILLVAWFPGRLLLNLTTIPAKSNSYFGIFLSLLTGTLLLSAGIAAYATGFKTILSLYFLFLAALWYFYRRRGWPGSGLFREFFSLKLLVMFAGAVILFSDAFIAMSGNSVFGFVFPWRDNIFYGLISNHIFNTGTESFYLNTILTNPAEARPVPYHYLELWLNAAVSQFFGGLYFLNLVLVTAVALQALIFAGLLALWENYFKKVNWPGLLICFQLLFLKGIVLNAYAETFPEVIIIDQLSVNATSLKFLTGYVFFLGFVNAIIRRHWLLGAMVLAAYPVAHIVALPGVLAGTASLLMLFLFRYRPAGLNKMTAVRALIAVGTGILLLVLFYSIFGAHRSGTQSQNLLLIIKTFRPDNLPAMLTAFEDNLVRAAVVTWLFLLAGLFLLVTWSRLKSSFLTARPEIMVFVFAAFALLGGALVSSIMHQSIEGHQPLQILVPVLNITISLVLILVLKNAADTKNAVYRNVVFAGVLGLLLFSFNPFEQLFRKSRASSVNQPYQQYAPEYLHQINQAFKTEKITPLGSCILGPKDLSYYYAYSPLHYTLGLYLPYMVNHSYVFSLSEFFTPFPEDPYLRKQAQDNTTAGVFYQFVQKQKAAGQFSSINQSQLDFIRQYRLGYVIISPNAPVNPLLEQEAKIALQDPVSGEKFLILK